MAYIGVSPSNGVRRKHTYTATASQTSFSGAGAEGATLSYSDSNFVDVYQNGVKLSEADYTSTSGTAIVLATGATVSDIIEVVVYDVFSVADTVSKSAGGTFDGNITAAGTLGVTGNVTLSADASVGDDLSLVSDGSIVNFGENSEISLTHVHNSGLTLASSVGATTFKIGRAGATDAKILFDGNAQDYHIGVDDTNDSLVIGLGNTLGTTDSMRFDANGIITKPLQPAFMVKPASAQTGLAHNTTIVFGTEIFDQNADFTNNTFTAPVTGRYQISFTLYFENVINNITNFYVTLELSNRSIYTILDPEAYDLTVTNLSVNFSLLCDMDASDTALLKYMKNGGGDTTNGNANSYFSGYLVA